MLKTAYLIFFTFIVSVQCFCQIQINGQATYLQGSGYYHNHSYLLGGGMSAKYMIAERLFIGPTIRTFKATTTAYEHLNSQDRILYNFLGEVEYMFSKRTKVQPFVGLAAGISATTHRIGDYRAGKNFTMFSLKGGANIAIGKSTGFFAQLQYNYTGDKPDSVPDGATNPVISEPITNFVAFDCGLYVRLYMRK